MKTTTIIREKLGLSQEILAFYLNITLSQLAMYEIGKRDLPTHALLKLAEIVLFLEKKIDVVSKINQEQELEIQNFKGLQGCNLKLQIEKEKRNLDKLIKKQNQEQQLLLLVNYMQKKDQESLKEQWLIKPRNLNFHLLIYKQMLKINNLASQLKHIEILK
jgi:transcriptional regulator with XRE-family HTH domain